MTAAMFLMLAGLAPDATIAAGLAGLARLWHQHRAGAPVSEHGSSPGTDQAGSAPPAKGK